MLNEPEPISQMKSNSNVKSSELPLFINENQFIDSIFCAFFLDILKIRFQMMHSIMNSLKMAVKGMREQSTTVQFIINNVINIVFFIKFCLWHLFRWTWNGMGWRNERRHGRNVRIRIVSHFGLSIDLRMTTTMEIKLH